MSTVGEVVVRLVQGVNTERTFCGRGAHKSRDRH
jgi:hypothetical protein